VVKNGSGTWDLVYRTDPRTKPHSHHDSSTCSPTPVPNRPPNDRDHRVLRRPRPPHSLLFQRGYRPPLDLLFDLALQLLARLPIDQQIRHFLAFLLFRGVLAHASADNV
jgi:hypothetical protein